MGRRIWPTKEWISLAHNQAAFQKLHIQENLSTTPPPRLPVIPPPSPTHTHPSLTKWFWLYVCALRDIAWFAKKLLHNHSRKGFLSKYLGISNAAAIRLIFSCACNPHLAISRNSKTLHPSVRLNSVFTSNFGFRNWTRYFSRSFTARALLILFVNCSTCRTCLSLRTLCVLYATSAHLARFLVSSVVPCSWEGKAIIIVPKTK